MTKIELESIIGEHVLDAVDIFVDNAKDEYGDFHDCQLIRFRLDGTVYTAIENPEDGYRSSLGSLIVSPNTDMKNTFPPISVLVRAKRHSDGEILEFIDLITTDVVIDVGTDRTDDYYPFFVNAFWPENMAINRNGR